MAKIGRNDPCPCGSGKKYKKCCIDKEMLAGLKHDPDSIFRFEEISGELVGMLGELHNKHESEFTSMSEEEFISISRKVFSNKNLDKYSFTYETMNKIIRKYGQPPNLNEPKSADNMMIYMKKVIKERYTDKDFTRICLDLYLLIPEFFKNKQYKECWAIEAANEKILDFKDGKKVIPLFFLEKFMHGMELYKKTEYKKHDDLFKHIGLDISDLEKDEGDILEKINNLSLTKEQEKLFEDYLKQNTDIKKEIEKSIEEDEKVVSRLLHDGELDQALFKMEEMQPQVKELGERFEEIQLPQQEGNMIKKKISKAIGNIMVELIDKWLPELFTEERWKYVISCFENKIKKLEHEGKSDKHKALVNITFLLRDSSAEREYIGKLIIGASLKKVFREYSENLENV